MTGWHILKKLMARPNSENYSDTFENEISNYISKNSSLFNELNYSITSEEINRAILLLKNNKSAGNDRILYEFLKTKYDPCKLQDLDINCLLYADDLVLISQSQDGLQNALDHLDGYCRKWKLTINTTKTKSIIFNKSGKIFRKYNLTLAKTPIETVQTYRYLGIDFTASGSFSTATNMLKDKANKALYTLKQSNIQGNITLGFKLFHTLIMPILNYCSEIWAPFFLKNINCINLTKVYDKNPLEIVHLKFCKYMLGVHKHSTNDAVHGELGSFPISPTFTKHALKYWARLT